MTTLLRRLGRDTLYVLVGFPLALLSFVVMVVGLSTSLGLLITLLGIPLAVLTLQAARGFAVVERARLQLRDGAPMPAAGHRRPGAGGWRGLLHRLRDQQSWLDALHAVIVLPLATVTFSLVVTWWAGAVGGLTYWVWARFLPPNDDGGLAGPLLGCSR